MVELHIHAPVTGKYKGQPHTHKRRDGCQVPKEPKLGFWPPTQQLNECARQSQPNCNKYRIRVHWRKAGQYRASAGMPAHALDTLAEVKPSI